MFVAFPDMVIAVVPPGVEVSVKVKFCTLTVVAFRALIVKSNDGRVCPAVMPATDPLPVICVNRRLVNETGAAGGFVIGDAGRGAGIAKRQRSPRPSFKLSACVGL